MISFKNFSHIITLVFCSIVPFNTCFAQETALSWTQWRGPDRNCEFTGPQWPDSLTAENMNKIWETKLGPSYSGPIVNQDTVFVTETVNQEFETVRALDRQTGQQKWETQWKGAMKVPFFAASNGSWIRATPVLDGDRLYVAGMRDVLVCLDIQNGDKIWQIDFVEKFGSSLPAFGFASSPLVQGDFIYVQAGGGLVKLDKLNGDVIWRKLADGGGMSGSAFSSPAIAEINGKFELLVQTRKRLVGMDLETGKEFWSQEIPAFRGMNILTPTYANNAVFTSSYGGGSYLFNINQNVDAESVEERWQNKTQAYMSSPVLIGNHLYLHLRNQRFSCLDWQTGEEKWRTKPFGKYWSMIYQNDRILALDERGDLMLIKADPEMFEMVGKVHLSDDSTWAHLAMSGNEIFVRSLNSQIAYRWE